MQKQIEKRIQSFVEGLGGITRTEMLHGTLYIKLDQESDCDFIHTELRDYYSCLLYTSPSPRDQRGSRMPSSA